MKMGDQSLSNGASRWSPLLIFTFISLLTLIPLLLSFPSPFALWNSFFQDKTTEELTQPKRSCDLFNGEWVSYEKPPYYTNSTCFAIPDGQNCIKNGRTDLKYLKWRWKPKECKLPDFDALEFLELVSGKSMAFVGDSMARGHVQSLICLLSRVGFPIDVSEDEDTNFRRWYYPSHNFTLQMFWSPYLVKTKDMDPDGSTSTETFSIYLDEFDEQWTSQVSSFNYVVLSAGYWFLKPSYETRAVINCNDCGDMNLSETPKYNAFRKALKTSFRAINGWSKFGGMIYVRTFAPSHYENQEERKGGKCVRSKPFNSSDITLEGLDLEFYRIQVEEFNVAESEGREKGMKYRLFDITKSMLLRPDGHPGIYGHPPDDSSVLDVDCVNWCLPGPVDTWSEFLLEMLKMDKLDS